MAVIAIEKMVTCRGSRPAAMGMTAITMATVWRPHDAHGDDERQAGD